MKEDGERCSIHGRLSSHIAAFFFATISSEPYEHLVIESFLLETEKSASGSVKVGPKVHQKVTILKNRKKEKNFIKVNRVKTRGHRGEKIILISQAVSEIDFA